jgi:meso-butanediol dehydrogenase/(S,S)-butanediol dehydrogenase/diacetyl reductase
MTKTRYDLADKVVVVTGAGSGIGRAIAQAFLEQGARVALLGRKAEALRGAAAGHSADSALVLPADVTDGSAVNAAVGQVLQAWGRIDTVIANAGLSLPGTIDDLDQASWTAMRSLNLDAVITLARLTVGALRDSRGSLIAVSSIASLGGDWNQTGYNATKAAVNALVQSMALDLGADGVRVNAIAPGFTATAQTRERLDDPDFRAKLMDRLGLQREGTPEDVARVALFLASEDAGYVTGVVLPVDGGTSAANGAPRPL